MQASDRAQLKLDWRRPQKGVALCALVASAPTTLRERPTTVTSDRFVVDRMNQCACERTRDESKNSLRAFLNSTQLGSACAPLPLLISSPPVVYLWRRALLRNRAPDQRARARAQTLPSRVSGKCASRRLTVESRRLRARRVGRGADLIDERDSSFSRSHRNDDDDRRGHRCARRLSFCA